MTQLELVIKAVSGQALTLEERFEFAETLRHARAAKEAHPNRFERWITRRKNAKLPTHPLRSVGTLPAVGDGVLPEPGTGLPAGGTPGPV